MNLEEANKPTSKAAINQGRAVRGIGFLYDLTLILVNLGGSGKGLKGRPETGIDAADSVSGGGWQPRVAGGGSARLLHLNPNT